VIVERDDVRVMFRCTTDEQHAITQTDVEAAIGSLRGMKFYGVFEPSANEYRVCVQWRDGDDAQNLGLEQGVIPGGTYVPSASRAIHRGCTA